MRVCVVSFSGRKNGNCAQIGRRICSLMPGAELYDLSEHILHPCGECGYACFQKGAECPWIGDKEYEIVDAVIRSDRTYFVLPNYCNYPCANFFIFSERSQCFFQKNPQMWEAYVQAPKWGIVVSNTNEENFKMVLADHGIREQALLILSARAYGRVSIAGDLLTSEQAAADIAAFVRGDRGAGEGK